MATTRSGDRRRLPLSQGDRRGLLDGLAPSRSASPNHLVLARHRRDVDTAGFVDRRSPCSRPLNRRLRKTRSPCLLLTSRSAKSPSELLFLLAGCAVAVALHRVILLHEQQNTPAYFGLNWRVAYYFGIAALMYGSTVALIMLGFSLDGRSFDGVCRPTDRHCSGCSTVGSADCLDDVHSMSV